MAESLKKLLKSDKDFIIKTGFSHRAEDPRAGIIEAEEPDDTYVLDIKHILAEINSKFEPEYAESFVKTVVEFLDKYYFRPQFVGFDPLPKRNNDHPLIYISNHSGMAFPWDAIIFAGTMLKFAGFDFEHAVRALVAPMLSASTYMNPYMINDFWKRLSGVDAYLENFEAMMHSSDADILIYPEGVPGIAKGFDQRYKLQKFSSSAIRMALKYKSDIIPVATVNGEYINPYSYRVDELNKLVQKLRIPFLPVGPLTTLVASPWAFYMGLPAKLTYVAGEPIRVYEMVDRPFNQLRKKDINHIRDAVQEKMQVFLYESVEKYGQDPYHWDEVAEIWKSNLDKILYILPSGWPLLFYEHDRLFREKIKEPMKFDNMSYASAALKNPDAVPFQVPVVGWIQLIKKIAWKD